MQNHDSTIWQLQEAKAKLSQLVKQAALGPQFISVHGEKAVVVLSLQDFNQLVQPSDNFWKFMQKSPLKGINLSFKRNKDAPRDIDL